jgi:GT2 family glycosyltransferase
VDQISVNDAMQRIYIIVLNWHGWRDTIECLESVLRLSYPNFRVLVCDNASSDGSLEHIRSWARGELAAEPKNPELASITMPPVLKPIPFVEIFSSGMDAADRHAPLVLIQTGANLGFAGGNNVGLRYAMSQGDCDFAWLLNNDTIVRPDALQLLVKRMQERPEAGICGSTLLYYHDPSKVQAWGGSVYNKWVARGGHIGKLANAARIPEPQEIESQMAYVIGASMLVRKSFLEQIGLMDEEYFLYFEELDWAVRAKGHFQLAYCSRSVVYHKEGKSIGSHRVTAQQSVLAEFYATRNRILFTRKYYPGALLTVLAAVAASAIHRLMSRRWGNFGAVVRGIYHGMMPGRERV